jgi:receptor-binding and translocation channel-forming TcA subunit of Tc toxin/ABC toxin-like protein/neuraminidase-like protein/hemopexin/virulence plasmid A protein
MSSDGSLPSYEQLFGELDFRPADESRSVYSPAAYLADLLQLAGPELTGRRPDLRDVPLDHEHSYSELPYLDIVNEVLAREVAPDGDAFEDLATKRYPFLAPFSLGRERLRQCLRQLGVDPVDLYRQFAPDEDSDVVAREYLGLSPADVAMVTTELADGRPLRECYRLDLDADDPYTELVDAARFRRAASLTAAELRELLWGALSATATRDEATELDEATVFFVHQGTPVSLDEDERQLVAPEGTGRIPVAWFDRANRFVRLARRTGLSFTDLELVLRTCCDNRIDLPALRAIAVVLWLRRAYDLPVDVVVSLVADVPVLGTGTGDVPADLFNRVFNVPFTPRGAGVLRGPGYLPVAYAERPELRCTGDILATANAEYRQRVAAAVGLAAPDLAAVVTRYTGRATTPAAGLFEQPQPGLAELSLLHRIGRITAALGITVAELFGVLDALGADPSIRRHNAFPILIDPTLPGSAGQEPDYSAILAGGDAAAGLWLMQTLFAVVRWLQATGLSSTDLLEIIGRPATAATPEAGSTDDVDTALLATISDQFGMLAPTAEVFQSGRFSQRAAQVIYDVIAAAGPAGGVPLLRVAPDRIAATAHSALTDLAVVAEGDFLGLGLDERFAMKVFANLRWGGYLGEDGSIVADRVPASAAELRLAGDFDARRDELFTLMSAFCTGTAGDDTGEALPVEIESSWYFPSDLAALPGLSETEQAELYDNLIFHGYLDASGRIQNPGFFLAPENAAAFVVSADLADLAGGVHERLLERISWFVTEPPALDLTIFGALPLSTEQLVPLVESLRFNGYLGTGDSYLDPVALTGLTVDEFALGLEFHPYRRQILDAVQGQLVAERTARYTVTPDDLRDLADSAAARRVLAGLDGAYLNEGRITAQTAAMLIDGAGADSVHPLVLGGFTPAEAATIAYQLGVVLLDAEPYRLDPAAVTALGFRPHERDGLLAYLVEAAYLTPALAVAPDRLEYFGYVHNALDFRLPGLEDYSKEVFFLLHRVATALSAGIAEISGALTALVAGQRAALFSVLGDALGVPAATAEAVAAALAGSADGVLDLFVVPVLDDPAAAAANPDLRRALRRLRGFARLAQLLNLSPTEATAAFDDQDLTGKFPEPLALPSGVDRIDALLVRGDGKRYLFHGRKYWEYPAASATPLEEQPSDLAELSPALMTLDTVDAAFVDATGSEWIVGRDEHGVPHSFVREPGRTRWAPREQEWGLVTNSFDDPPRIDAAFVDEGGRTYLFRGEQYVRYSGEDLTHVDEGYPRRIGEWWENERRSTPLPVRFRESLDAAFHGRDDVTYLFAGDSFVAVRGDAVGKPVAEQWGRVANALAGAERVDAAYACGSTLAVFAGNQVFQYSSGIETAGVYVDDGHPRRIEAYFGDVPVEFEGGVEAAFAVSDETVHLFKDGRTVIVNTRTKAVGTVVPTPQRWGRLGPALPGGRVDAALAGMDGRTYLFSGDRYVRYSTTDYSVVDVGWPRAIAGDWGGLRKVDAAFVSDGATYLFGTAGLLGELAFEDCEAELAAGRVPRAVRRLLRDHDVPVADDAGVTVHTAGKEWKLSAERGIGLLLCRTKDTEDTEDAEFRLQVRCDEATTVAFHVRYSTRDYTKPDTGYPKPLTDNWWNLPDELVGPDLASAKVDAVLTGRDGRTYLFAGGLFVVYDNKRRWWSAPQSLRDDWDSLPFEQVDAAFVGADGKTYLFSGQEYVRYSGSDYTRVDDRYPAAVTPFWGNVVNNLARTGRVDAGLVLDAGDGTGTTYTYLFSGDQFVRYTRTVAPAEGAEVPYYEATAAAAATDPTEPGEVDLGYPRRLPALCKEPGLANLRATLDGVDAAFADRGSVYLLRGQQIHAVSAKPYRRYDNAVPTGVGCAFVDDGALHVEHTGGWYRYSTLEAAKVDSRRARPRALRGVPEPWRTGLDAVLRGTDGNTYLFQGTSCFTVDLGKGYALAEEWGRPRNNLYHDDRVDAAFAGTDGRTYVFSGDQFVVYPTKEYTEVDGGPRPIAEHWAGLTRVTLAYVRGGSTYVFGPVQPDGTRRYLVYSGDDYGAPDAGYPSTVDAAFWGVPEQYRPAGFTGPTAVLSSGDSLLLLVGGEYLQYNESAKSWSYPRPLERLWPGLGKVDGLVTAFAGADSATYFFFDDGFVRHHDGTAAAREPVRRHWGRTRNNFLARTGDDIVDAAVVVRGVTYLFSGEQYVRYSGPDYRFVDAGYPRPIVGNLRTEEGFTNLPASFDDDLAERFAGGSRSMIDGAVADDRHVYLFVDRTCHVAARDVTASYDLGVLGRVRNNIVDRQRVDAALVTDSATLLFSGDQYVRYGGTDYTKVDDGYPRTIAESLHAELGVTALPVEFHDGLDAAVRADGHTFLFAKDQYLTVDGLDVQVAPVRGTWGVVRNTFRATNAGLDAAFVAPTGELYAFAGDQYIRYRPGKPEKVEDGYPRLINDAWGDLPDGFEERVDAGFTLDGRVYLGKEEEYVRYSGASFAAVDRTYPQSYRHRWCDAADYRLGDLRTITRVAELARTHPDLVDYRTVTDPYRDLADQFGWDIEEIRWCRRHSRFLSGAAVDEENLEWEFLLELVDLFAVTSRLGAGPSRILAEVWSKLYPEAGVPDEATVAGVADTMYALLADRTDAQQWPVLARQLHDELNLAKRDALVATVLADIGGDSTSRDLFDRFLIDVDMGSRGNTSRVREGIAAAQLYLHRYLLNLEGPEDDEPARQRVKLWWQWMRAYRVWEANRKVFLYPENYLRPELRSTKTPAFATLESDLLQGEITAGAVEQAYKRYLDEYTEVSRLAIAGGYVYTKDRAPGGPRRLVLFGRTRTAPRRYHYRRAEFASREKFAGSWEPWQPVNVQIDADHVHPVHAFGRVFVFWTVTEPVREEAETGTTIVTRGEGDTQHISSTGGAQRIKILYSFHNLNKDWVPAQTLGVGPSETGAISGETLLVQPRLAADGERVSIVVAGSYTVTNAAADPATREASVLFELNPELYATDLSGATDAHALAVAIDLDATQATAATAERVAEIFVDPVDPSAVVRFDAPTRSETWFSADHMGGSFLCRPVIPVEQPAADLIPLDGNDDGFPEWPVHAAVELPDGTRYFFDEDNYVGAAEGEELSDPARTGSRWGRARTVLPESADVNALLVRGEYTYAFFGDQYVRFTGTPFETIDEGYPKPLADNRERFPQWEQIDLAFTGADGFEYFFSRERGVYTTSADLTDTTALSEHWLAPYLPAGVTMADAALVTDNHTFLLWPGGYVRYTHPWARRNNRDAPAYEKPGRNYPRRLGETETTVAGQRLAKLPAGVSIDALQWREGIIYVFDNAAKAYHEIFADGTSRTRPAYVGSAISETDTVDAAWATDEHLFLASGTEYVRYTLDTEGGPVPDYVDDGYPKPFPGPVDTVLRREDDLYVFRGNTYARGFAGQEPIELPALRPVDKAWGDLPSRTAPLAPFDAALDSARELFLFIGNGYRRYPKDVTVRRPYELAGLPFEIIRLTTGTAAALNQRLLSAGVPALLDLSTQETDEVAVTTDLADTTAVRVWRSRVDTGHLPTGSHLDFSSANGLYYQEIFFHAPLLIAHALNGAQRFEDAKRWYEYVFDPTHAQSYWRFLPFLAIDLDLLADRLDEDVAALDGLDLADLSEPLDTVLGALRALAPVMLQNRRPVTDPELEAKEDLTDPDVHEAIADAVDALAARTDLTGAQREAVAGLRERTGIAADLEKQLDALGDYDGLLDAYRDDPFDPHAIADLRPVAYRRAVVMGYVDNLLDWGDLLFRQYTPETVDEARMLYLFAYDLLGAQPERLGTRLLPPARSLEGLEQEPDDTPGTVDLLGYLTSGGVLVEGEGEVHAGIGDAYFHIPENSVFHGYWERVADRLHKIRQSLNILGISQPLPLFSPPIDPMALVRSVAAGDGVDPLALPAAVPVPHHRFAVVFRRAQDLTSQLRQLGNDLLGVLERGSAEELGLLQGRQERQILGLTRAIKQAQVGMAEDTVAELTASKDAAQEREEHYQDLINTGMTAREQAQVGLMGTAAALQMTGGVINIASGLAYAFPDILLGPFIVGTKTGGKNVGEALDKFAQSTESMGEGFSMIGEALGIQAQHDRMVEDWTLQLATARSDVTQIGHRLAAATRQVAVAQHELAILDQQIAHNEAVATFMRDKFTNAQLYGWMSDRLGALYFQAYHLAYDMARAAERAFHFEHGVTESEATSFIRPVHWESRRNGLLAGESLSLDLERLGAAHLELGGRGLEITRHVSLLALDPVALLRLRNGGSCEFTLAEALFDEDFPGHFRRQIRTVAATLTDAEGQPLPVNATLTQLGHKTVLEPDTQAVKYLLEPQGEPPGTIRGEWRAGQRIALSYPEYGRDNNGMFELRYDDDRYLPFEGTGAVSTWRLQRSGRVPADLHDVLITVRYTAEHGGEIFANAVRGMLKPYPAARFFDLARDFPQEWGEFIGNGAGAMVLPFTPEMFPDLAGRQITGMYATYDLTGGGNGGGSRLLLGGDPAMALNEASMLPTPGLALRGDSPTNWSFTVDGEKENLRNVGLVLTYQASVQ